MRHVNKATIFKCSVCGHEAERNRSVEFRDEGKIYTRKVMLCHACFVIFENFMLTISSGDGARIADGMFNGDMDLKEGSSAISTLCKQRYEKEMDQK